MDAQMVGQLIGSYGFPIYMCILFATSMKKTLEGVTQSINSNTQTINSNTQIVMQLQQKIEQMGGKAHE
ncbi:TPA: hypothetical protein ACR3Z0_005920 [Bacillus thuringiensis]|uniref:Uncharacterized protein n=6 Tax=root TaxID=1 RepID=Q6X3U9_BP35C|nr:MULTISPECIES: hypothetical protein [Bacillales]NP_943766.1 holin [Bacillus phage Bam35c]AND28847.1 hypothetical protein ATN07_34650 [Bacillus phage pGIL02]EAO54938.1 Hypothetical protein RBTH_07633 [Bacillus thuringiensis serovar israelensis ATCC 35646]MCU4918516.1 hypothetical protein [Bacillus cereus]CAD59960.1 hypothetical protein [Bacillus phage pGIL01]AAP83489.1 putative protein 20 [Bacillus phage Bam35c]